MSGVRRRAVLAGVAGAVATVTGCSGLVDDGATPTATATAAPLPDEQPARYLALLRRPDRHDDTDERTPLSPGIHPVVPDGPSGHPFDVLGATFDAGTLRVTGEMASTSLYPVFETQSGLQSPFFQHHERLPAIEHLAVRVRDCKGRLLATAGINREWVERFWAPDSNMTVGDYVALKRQTWRGCRELDTPAEYAEGVPQREWTCEDWLDANPDLGDGACFQEATTQ